MKEYVSKSLTGSKDTAPVVDVSVTPVLTIIDKLNPLRMFEDVSFISYVTGLYVIGTVIMASNA
jgi:hypothetical protein